MPLPPFPSPMQTVNVTYVVTVKLCVLVTQDWELADTDFLRDALVSYYGIPLAAITVTRTYSDCAAPPGRRRLMQLSPPPPSPPPGNGTNSTNSTNSSAANTTAVPFPPPGPVAWARGISLDMVIQTSSNASAQQVQQLFVSAAMNSSVAATLTAQLIQNALPNAFMVLSVADVSAVTVLAPPSPAAPPAPPGRVGGSRLAPLSLLCVLVLVLMICGPSTRRCVARLRARLPKKTVAFWAECELLVSDDFYASNSWVRGVYDAARRAASQPLPRLPRPVQLRVEAALQRALGKVAGTTSVQLTMCAVVWSDDAGPRMLRVCGNANFSGLGAFGMDKACDRAEDFQDSLSEAQTMSGYSHTPLAATVTEAMQLDPLSRGVHNVRLWPVVHANELAASDVPEECVAAISSQAVARRIAMLEVASDGRDADKPTRLHALLARKSTDRIPDMPISSAEQYAQPLPHSSDASASLAIRALVGVRAAPVLTDEPAAMAIRALSGVAEPRVSIFDSGMLPRRALRPLGSSSVRRSWHAGSGGVIPATPMDSSFTSDGSAGDVERGEASGQHDLRGRSALAGRRRSAPAGERSRSGGRDRSDSPLVMPPWR